jgi:hypothetical protein
MPDHRVRIDPNQFRTAPIERKLQPIRRHRTDVVVGFAGTADHNEKRVTINKALWCVILRFAGHDPDKVFFDRSDSRHTAVALESGAPLGFDGDEEATSKLREVLEMFRQGRPVSVIGERFV